MKIYSVKKLLVEGTKQNPETFITGQGKLATDSFGVTFPAFNALNQAIHISKGLEYQDATINGAGFQAITDYGALTFKLAVSDAGSPSQDGKYYIDLAFIVQNRC